MPALVLLWTSFFGYTLPTRATAADFSTEPTGSCSPTRPSGPACSNTALVAGVSAAIVTAIGAVLGWIISRSALPGRRLLDFLSVMSVGIPAVIVGLAVMVLYLSLPIGIYGTVWILILAYSYRFATTTRLARAGFLQIHQELEEASAVSGARLLTTQRRVLLPLILPALTVGLHPAVHRRRARVHAAAGALQPGERGAVGAAVAAVPERPAGARRRRSAPIMIAVVLPVIFLTRRILGARSVAE